MARDQVDLTPIERRAELVDWIAQGVKPRSRFRIGTEHAYTSCVAFGLERWLAVLSDRYDGDLDQARAAVTATTGQVA